MRCASRWLSGRGRAALGLLALALACVTQPTIKPELPEHLRPIVEGWADVARRNIAAVFDEQHTSCPASERVGVE